MQDDIPDSWESEDTLADSQKFESLQSDNHEGRCKSDMSGKCDSGDTHVMTQYGDTGATQTPTDCHYIYQLGPKNQTPTVKIDFTSHPASRCIFSIHCCPDTGATVSVVKASIVKQKNLKILPSGISNLRDAQGIFMKVEGKVFVSIRGGDC